MEEMENRNISQTKLEKKRFLLLVNPFDAKLSDKVHYRVVNVNILLLNQWPSITISHHPTINNHQTINHHKTIRLSITIRPSITISHHQTNSHHQTIRASITVRPSVTISHHKTINHRQTMSHHQIISHHQIRPSVIISQCQTIIYHYSSSVIISHH